MYKVFIVDDEEYVIKSLIAQVDWTSYGFEIVGYSYDSSNAFDQICLLEPDLIFIDIRMPGMNGLELMKNLTETVKTALFIVISGYAEFAYAQKAINYGAFGYCLKPFDSGEIISYLQKAAPVLTHMAKSSGTCDPDICYSNGIPLNVRFMNHTFNLIIKYVHEYYNQDITVQRIAQAVNVNANYVSQLFKKETGSTYTKYLSKLRVENACKLLIDTDLSVSEIARQVGYSDYFYFSRVFKKIKGKSPSVYRMDIS